MRQLLIVSLTLVLASCSRSPMDEARASIEAHFKPQMDDPSSYEFVRIDSLRPYTESDSLRDYLEGPLEAEFKAAKDKYFDERTELYSLELDALINDDLPPDHKEDQRIIVEKKRAWVEKDSARVQQVLTKMGTLAKRADSDEAKANQVGYLTVFVLRGKNKMGALVMKDYVVQLTNDLRVVKMEPLR